MPSDAAAPPPEEPGATETALLEQVLERENLLQALKRVKANRGAPGIDGMTVKQLEGRGHAFCRYADDCNIYVRSRRSGERVKESVTRFLTERLKLTVNEAKSAVDRPWKRKFLGFSFTNRKVNPQIRVAGPSLARAKSRIRQLTWRWKGQSMEQTMADLNAYLRGWGNYFALIDAPRPLSDLDEWVRRRLRAILWHLWKTPKARARHMSRLGIPAGKAREWAYSKRGPWRMSGSAPLQRTLDNAYWRAQGLVSLVELQKARSSR